MFYAPDGVTHAHPVGMDGAAVQARAIAQAVTMDPKEPFLSDPFVQGLIEFARTPEIRRKMIRVQKILAEKTPPQAAANKLGRTVAVHESMPFAIYSFLRHPKSFAECLFCAVLNGGDRDTLGAMACAISGAYLGIEAIPAAWHAKLQNQSYIEELGPSWVAGMLRNGWPESIGMPGRNGSEQVAGISRNQWPECSGIRSKSSNNLQCPYFYKFNYPRILSLLYFLIFSA